MAKASTGRKTTRGKTTRSKPARRKPARGPARGSTARRKSKVRSGSGRWSARVTRESDALDLKGGVFKSSDPRRIAASLKRSAERSNRRKSSPYRSAVSMLNFYINRAGKNLPAGKKRTLERAKAELRKQFGRD